MVTSTLSLNEKCCFDFGNAEANNLDKKAGHMDAINIMCQGKENILRKNCVDCSLVSPQPVPDTKPTYRCSVR